MLDTVLSFYYYIYQCMLIRVHDIYMYVCIYIMNSSCLVMLGCKFFLIYGFSQLVTNYHSSLRAVKCLTNNFKLFEIGGHSFFVADMGSGKIT